MKKLPAAVKLAFGAGDFGFSVSYTIIAFYLLFYLSDVVKINPAWVGTAMLLAKVWDAVIDPFVGNFSDRLQTRWGRRRPFFILFAVPFGATFVLLWAVPTGWNFTMTLIYVAVAFILHITAYSLMSVPYTSLTAELTDDYDERTRLTAYRMAFSIIGGLAAAVVPPMIAGAYADKARGYGVMGLIFGVVIILSPLAVFFGCREKPATRRPEELPLWEGVKLVFANKPFVLVIFMFLLSWVSMEIISTTLMFFLKYVLGMEGASDIIIGIIFLVAAGLLPFWVWVSGRLGKKKAYIIGMSYLAVILLAISLAGRGMETVVFVLAALAGVGVSAIHVLPHAIIPDCIEVDELKTGTKRSGAYYGVISFLQQLAASIGVFVSGQVLNLSGYVPDAAQSASAVLGIRLLLGVTPAVLLILGIVVISFYKIDRTEHDRIKERIAGNSYIKETERNNT